jgi:hypothetical protein
LTEQPEAIIVPRPSNRDEGATVARDGLENYRSGSSQIIGGLGLAAAALVAGLVVLDYQEGDWRILVGCAFVALGLWAVLLRPMIAIRGDQLELRGMISQVLLPLAAVESISVAQYVTVRSVGNSWTCPGVGRTKRQLSRMGSSTAGDLTAAARGRATDSGTVANFVTVRILQLAEDARAKAGVAMMSEEQFALAEGVRRTWAWPVIGGLVALAVVFAVAVLT